MRSIMIMLPGLSLILCTACGKTLPESVAFLDASQANPINSLKPESASAQVVIEGQVSTIAPLIGKAAYEVKDTTGTVWVLTNGKAPERDTKVKIHGTLRVDQGELYVEQQ
jgi:hypothetical protein